MKRNYKKKIDLNKSKFEYQLSNTKHLQPYTMSHTDVESHVYTDEERNMINNFAEILVESSKFPVNDQDKVRRLTVPQLKDVLRSVRLKVNGSKDELVLRILSMDKELQLVLVRRRLYRWVDDCLQRYGEDPLSKPLDMNPIYYWLQSTPMLMNSIIFAP